MSTILLIFFLAALSTVLIAQQNRTAKIRRYAARNAYSFEKTKNTLTTAQTADRLAFFKAYFHLFFNVITFSDQLAFMRLADDQILTDDQPNTKPVFISVFTAEFRSKTFPSLKITAKHSSFISSKESRVRTNIPAIDAHYVLHAPTQAAGLLLTPFLVGLLKTQTQIHLEVNDNALIYHENRLIPAQQYAAFHLRAMQILAEFENLFVMPDASAKRAEWSQSLPAAIAAPHNATQPPLEDAPSWGGAPSQAEAMLLLAKQSSTPVKAEPGPWRTVFATVLLALLILLPMLAWLIIRHFVK